MSAIFSYAHPGSGILESKQGTSTVGRSSELFELIGTLWSPWRVTTLFVAVSLVWIVGTDWLLQALVSDDALAGKLQTWKGLVWILLVAVLIFKLLDRTRKRQRLLYQEIEQQQELLESRVHERTAKLLDSREQLRMLTRRLDRLAEVERKTISRELHDQMGSDLTSLKIDLQSIGKAIPAVDLDGQKRVETALTVVDSMYLSFRQIASRLRPSILDDCGLSAGIEWLADEFERRSGCTTRIDVSDDSPPGNEIRDTALFRICQESLTNVLKHAKATRVTVSLSTKNNLIELVIEDNGVGLASDEDNPHQQLGVVGMQERAIAVGGTATVDAVEGGGTRIRVTVPLDSQDGMGS